MGQHGSAEAGPPPTIEALHHHLTQRLTSHAFSPLELYTYTRLFRTHARNTSNSPSSSSSSSGGVRYWDERTLIHFLGIPDPLLGAGPVLHRLVTYLAAFPFPSEAPAILEAEALLRVVGLCTGRWARVVGRDWTEDRWRRGWWRECFRGLAVFDRGLVGEGGGKGVGEGEEEEDGAEDEDDLVLATLESLGADEVVRHGEEVKMHRHLIVPTDNFLRFLQLLLLIAPLEPQESLATYAADLSEERLDGLRRTAGCILASFGVESSHGITYKVFDAVVSATLPFLFDGLSPLFEHFLFDTDLDLSKRKDSASSPPLEKSPASPQTPFKPLPPPEPVLREPGEILDHAVLSQLSFFIKGDSLFRRLRLLYSSNEHGCSMGSFSKAVFNWRSPTILLVTGTLLPPTPSDAFERTFSDSLPPSRLPTSLAQQHPSLPASTPLTYGAYLPVPWKQTHKTPFGDAGTLLFQLAPTHDVFPASPAAAPQHDYAYFNKPPTHPSGLGFGTPIPPQSSSTTHFRSGHATSGGGPILTPGPVSLHLTDSLEFGAFTHLSSGGGTYRPSTLPARRGRDWQDRFRVDALEVWGCGGDVEADAQRRAWAWEEREAAARRRVNVGGTGDVEADRELLRMAGLLGGGGERSGGSV